MAVPGTLNYPVSEANFSASVQAMMETHSSAGLLPPTKGLERPNPQVAAVYRNRLCEHGRLGLRHMLEDLQLVPQQYIVCVGYRMLPFGRGVISDAKQLRRPALFCVCDLANDQRLCTARSLLIPSCFSHVKTPVVMWTVYVPFAHLDVTLVVVDACKASFLAHLPLLLRLQLQHGPSTGCCIWRDARSIHCS